MSGIARVVTSVVALAVMAAGCSSDSQGASATATSTTIDGTGDAARGRLTIGDDTLVFSVDVCYHGDGTDLSPDLRLDVEGDATNAAGARFRVQIVQTQSPVGDQIDVIRVRPKDGPIGASREAQRVVSADSGQVQDQWGAGTTALLGVSRSSKLLTVTAHNATFGAYPGAGGDPEVIGTGDLKVTCQPVG